VSNLGRVHAATRNISQRRKARQSDDQGADDPIEILGRSGRRRLEAVGAGPTAGESRESVRGPALIGRSKRQEIVARAEMLRT